MSESAMHEYADRKFKAKIPQLNNPPDVLGFPSRIELEDTSRPYEGLREYSPRNLALLNETESGGVYCSCCGRQLKREYMFSPSWRFCPKCGAEVMR